MAVHDSTQQRDSGAAALPVSLALLTVAFLLTELVYTSHLPRTMKRWRDTRGEMSGIAQTLFELSNQWMQFPVLMYVPPAILIGASVLATVRHIRNRESALASAARRKQMKWSLFFLLFAMGMLLGAGVAECMIFVTDSQPARL